MKFGDNKVDETLLHVHYNSSFAICEQRLKIG